MRNAPATYEPDREWRRVRRKPPSDKSFRLSRLDRRFESGLRVMIADNGPGIRTEDRPKIFRPSFTTKPQKGAGMGLWVAKSIIEKYRGRIVVKTRARPDAHGTSVSVFLPEVGVVPSRSH